MIKDQVPITCGGGSTMFQHSAIVPAQEEPLDAGWLKRLAREWHAVPALVLHALRRQRPHVAVDLAAAHAGALAAPLAGQQA